MRIYKAFSAVVLVGNAAAGSVPMMSPVPKPPFKNETKHSTAETLVTTITSDYSFYCPETTTFHHKNFTYTATEPTYMTITNCLCTITYTQNTQFPGKVVYPTAPPGQPMSPTSPAISSSAPAPPLPPSKPALPPTKATVPYSEQSLPPAIPKSTVTISEAPPPPPPPPP
ncbi:cell wall SED1, partial [Fusarium sp. NRRL 52700]